MTVLGFRTKTDSEEFSGFYVSGIDLLWNTLDCKEWYIKEKFFFFSSKVILELCC